MLSSAAGYISLQRKISFAVKCVIMLLPWEYRGLLSILLMMASTFHVEDARHLFVS